MEWAQVLSSLFRHIFTICHWLKVERPSNVGKSLSIDHFDTSDYSYIGVMLPIFNIESFANFFYCPPGGAKVSMSVWFSRFRNTSNIQGPGFTRKTDQFLFRSIWLCCYTLQFTIYSCILTHLSEIYFFHYFQKIEILRN